MSKALQPVRGTHDLLGEDMRVHRHLADVARRVSALYGCAEAATPVFEFTEVFHRTLGETSDVVSKETYTFEDRGGESITLRPELTASLVRAFISGGYTQQLPFKAFYSGPALRYERPQKGRQRQFHQFGVEMLGADSPLYDVEAIACAHQVLGELGLAEEVTLELNSLGDAESRADYRAALVDYLSQHKAVLSPESQARLERNPLRILDSKQAEDQAVIAAAPQLSDSLTDEARAWFESVKNGLDALGIAYAVSPRLVRGLDYYTHTVFEFTTEALGSQNTVCAGGRYDGLVAQMGGPDVQGMGWAAGMERLALLLAEREGSLPAFEASVAVLPFGEAEQMEALTLLQALRNAGIKAELFAKGNIGKRFKKLDKQGITQALVLGSDELATGVVTLKNLASGEQQTVPLGEVASVIGSASR